MVLTISVSMPNIRLNQNFQQNPKMSIWDANKESLNYDTTPRPTSLLGKWEGVRNSTSDWIPSLKALGCTLALAMGLNNVSRLPREVSHYGGLPFLLAHAVLMLLVSLPLVFLEIGLGQFCERGVTKLWRAVPAFRGLAYIKLSKALICATYTFIYISLAISFLIRVAKGPVPLTECLELRILETGYKVNTTTGLECVRNALLPPILSNPASYGINASIIFVFWLSLSACLYKKEKSFRFAIISLAFGVITCAIVAVVYNGISGDIRLLFTCSDWRMLTDPGLWHSALMQSFFSLHLGLGYLITSSATVYNNRNAKTTSIIYVVANVLVGWICVLLWYKHADGSETSVIDTLIVVYDAAVAKDGSRVGPSFAFALFALAGSITVLALLFPIYNSIWVDITGTWKIFTATSFSVVTGLIISLLILAQGIELVTVLDEYVVPALLTFVVFMEAFSFAYIYDHKNVYSVLSFLLGETISDIWKVSWSVTPFIVLGLAVWRVWGYTTDGFFWQFEEWHLWLTVGLLLAALLVFLATAIWVMSHQVDYSLKQKICSSFKASYNWGPADPIRRYGWLQWTSSEGTDFTLRRKGTLDYTNSARRAGYTRRLQRRQQSQDPKGDENPGRYGATGVDDETDNNCHILDVISRSPQHETAVITSNGNNRSVVNNEMPSDQPYWHFFHDHKETTKQSQNFENNNIESEDSTKF